MIGAMAITAREMHEHAEINNQLAEYERKFDNGSLSREELGLDPWELSICNIIWFQ